jgi:hypothetical protein
VDAYVLAQFASPRRDEMGSLQRSIVRDHAHADAVAIAITSR